MATLNWTRRRVVPAIAITVATVAVAFVPATATASAGATVQSTAKPDHVDILSTKVSGIDVDSSTIPQLQTQMNRGRLSSTELVRFYERRIAVLNPKLHAVITVSRTALAEAASADRARRNGDRRPLLGIPILVKDNIDTTGMPTTAGSLALAGSTPPDAFIIKKLKAAGALILGKTNLSEWANYRSTQSSSGWSGVGGQTHMAYVLDRNPCGSSAGSGVAASADLATVAIGTETDGSVVCPSGQNGLVGIKPTLGLASRSGIVPISSQQDTAGPMARNVTDAAVLLGALTGVDPTDSATAAQRGKVTADYTRYLKAGSLKGARLGVWREGNFGSSPETDAIMEKTIKKLKSLGAVIVDPANVPIEAAYADENTALQYEFKAEIAAYLKKNTSAKYPKTLQDLINFDNSSPRELKYFGQEIFEQAQAQGPLTDPAYIKARNNARSVAQHSIDDTMAKYKLDAIIAPTNSPAWTTDLINGDHFLVGSSSPAAIAGYPNITVPAGYSFHLPVGVSFLGGRWDEPELISLTYSWEQATKIRQAPQFLKTVPTE
ncbi:amidase [Nakamurella sp. UYEF19]|uniref:amidase n=1 Tax=Nakamurella sp. UYEF19 TaxID=1756392 RepID=UPI0033914598